MIYSTIKILNLQRNVVVFQESWLNSYTSQYYDMVGVAPQYFNQRGQYQDTLYKIYIGMSDKYLLHRRESYIIFDVLGDLGGVLEFLVFFFGMIMLPMSEYSFNMSAFKKLYLVKSKAS